MPFPLLIGVGLLVTVCAATAAWVIDSATEEERKRHDRLARERDELSDALRDTEEQGQHVLRRDREQQAERFAAGVLRLLDEKEKSQRVVEQELETLWTELQRELGRRDLNPWRRRTLLSRATQIEDARARVQAHRAYRQWYREQVARLRQLGCLAELRSMELPSAIVPVEWLYIGKVVRVAADELGRPLQFGHRLRLQRVPLQDGVWSSAPQDKMLLDYPQSDAVPVQVVGFHKGWFEGCVGRGILHVDHILPGQPAEFCVERSFKDGVIGSLMNGTVTAVLPHQRTAVPGLRIRPDECFEVWPELFDLCLKSTPGAPLRRDGRPHPGIQVTQRAPAGHTAQRQLALAVGDALPDADALLDVRPDTWRLEGFDEAQGLLILVNDPLRLTARLEQTRGLLVAKALERCGPSIGGLQVPLYIEPVDARLIDDTLLHWPEALEALYGFAMQAADDPVRQQRRQQQAQFMERWQQVIDYQKQREMCLSLAFTAQARLGEDGQLEWDVAQDLEGDPEQWRQTWRDTLKDCGGAPARSLEMWLAHGDGEASWVPVARVRRPGPGPIEVIVEPGAALRVRARALRRVLGELCAGQPQRMRLTLQLSRPDLARQEKALRDFTEDRLLEPALKELLLAPEYYRPVADSFWQARIQAGLPWANTRLTDIQRQVIETCLVNKHLALVQGPPGTAKTTCIVEMLHQVFTAQPSARVLVVSQQNAAVDNALERFRSSPASQALFEQQQVRLLRVGRTDKISETLQDSSLEAAQQRRIDQWMDTAQHTLVHGRDSVTRGVAGQWFGLLQGYQCTVAEQPWKRCEELTLALLQGHNLVGATCVGLASTRMGQDQLQFDLVIIDEAGRATVPELLIPLLRARKVVLIGDHFQLPPAVAPLLREEQSQQDLPFLTQAFLETSFFEHLFEALPSACRARLQEQYRMAAPIGDLVADLFYSPGSKRTLFNGQRAVEPALASGPPLAWVDVAGQQQRQGTSQFNVAEADAIVDFLAERAAHARARLVGGATMDVAVITPYGAQKREIVQRLNRLPEIAKPQAARGDKGELRLGPLSIRVDTVDSFQGSEAHLVCYSTVRTAGSLQFLLDEKRLNVACSRAREQLVFFGDADFLHRARPRPGQHNHFAQILKRAVMHQYSTRRAPASSGTTHAHAAKDSQGLPLAHHERPGSKHDASRQGLRRARPRPAKAGA